MTNQTTGLDVALALDAIYYSAPLPRNMAVLTVLGSVFDKVYFPSVYMPKNGYDDKELQKEIDRLRALPTSDLGTLELVGMLEFVKHVKALDGFCVFTGDREKPFLDHNKVPGQMVRDLFFAIHGPQPPGWEPMFHSCTNGVADDQAAARATEPFFGSLRCFRHQPRRPPLAKIRPGSPAPAMGLKTEPFRAAHRFAK